jgi:hypothetical protein
MRADSFAPGDGFESEKFSLRSALLELNDEVFRTEVATGPTANGGPLHRHLHREELLPGARGHVAPCGWASRALLRPFG